MCAEGNKNFAIHTRNHKRTVHFHKVQRMTQITLCARLKIIQHLF